MKNLNLTETQLAKLTYPDPSVCSKKYGVIARLNTETFEYEVYLDAFVKIVLNEAFETAPIACAEGYDVDPWTLVDADTEEFLEQYKAEFEKGLLNELTTEENLEFLHGMESQNIFADIAVIIFNSTQSHVMVEILLADPQDEKPDPYDSGKNLAYRVIDFIGHKYLTSDYCYSSEGYQGLVKFLRKDAQGLDVRFIKSFDYKDELTNIN